MITRETTKQVSAAEAAARIPDGAVVTVSSSSALGCPDAVLRTLGERFATEGQPRNLTMLTRLRRATCTA